MVPLPVQVSAASVVPRRIQPFDLRLTELRVPERLNLIVGRRATRVHQPEAFSGKPFAVQLRH